MACIHFGIIIIAILVISGTNAAENAAGEAAATTEDTKTNPLMNAARTITQDIKQVFSSLKCSLGFECKPDNATAPEEEAPPSTLDGDKKDESTSTTNTTTTTTTTEKPTTNTTTTITTTTTPKGPSTPGEQGPPPAKAT